MADITHGTWIKDGKAVDSVYQSGVKVYGRNLYADTENFDNSSVWNNYHSWSKNGDKYDGLTVMSTTDDWNGLGQAIQSKKGETYTFSIYARYESGTGHSNMYFSPPGVNSTDIGTVGFYLNETWQRLTATFTITADGPIYARIERTNDNTNTLLTAGLKLEIGTISTPYSIAPEDILN